jgi:hypothetical protein
VIEPINAQLGRLLFEALKEDRVYQVELARRVGVSPKHMNQMVHGKSGSLAMYEYAAFVLGRRWQLTLVPRE